MSWPYDPRTAVPRTPRATVLSHLWLAVGAALCFGLILFVVRAPVSRCFGFGVVAGFAAFALLRATEVRSIDWPAAPPGRAGKVAAAHRWRMNGFDAMVDPVPGFSPHLHSRLRSLAARQLAARQLEPGSPAAEHLLGASTHALLFPPERVVGEIRRDPDREQLLALIDRLIALDVVPRAPAAAEHLSLEPTVQTGPAHSAHPAPDAQDGRR